jgi:hypothetical protein
MKLFKSLTPESVLVGLGITAIMYIVTPMIKEFVGDVKSNKKVFSFDENMRNKIAFNKCSLR